MPLDTIDVSWVSAVIAILTGVLGATVGFGRRNTSLAQAQSQAVDAAALRITTLEGENTTLRTSVSSLEGRLATAERRIDAAERMATSKDLILAIAAYYNCPEEILHPYRDQPSLPSGQWRRSGDQQ